MCFFSVKRMLIIQEGPVGRAVYLLIHGSRHRLIPPDSRQPNPLIRRQSKLLSSNRIHKAQLIKQSNSDCPEKGAKLIFHMKTNEKPF